MRVQSISWLARLLIASIWCLFGITALAAEYSSKPPEIADVASSSDVINESNWRMAVAGLQQPTSPIKLPTPRVLPSTVMHLSLREAILLALRNNPSVLSADLNRVVDKFALLVAHHAFEPHFLLNGNTTLANGSRPVYSGNAGVNLTTTIGTQLGFTYNNTYANGGDVGQANLSVTQPLLRGFGRDINLIPWLNALDHENISRLSFKETAMQQVVAIITAYYQLEEDYQNLAIQRRTLKINARMIQDSALRVKVGQQARSDLMQQKATYETTQLSLLQQQSAFITDYQNFLAALGLNASAKVKIDYYGNLKHVSVPTIARAIQLALHGNVDYQKQLIAIRALKRSVLTAKDAARWQLNLSGNLTLAAPVTPPQFITVNGVTTVQSFVVQNSPSVMLSLDIPLDDVQLEQAQVNAAVQLQQAKLALDQAQLALTRKITNAIQQIHNQMRTVQAALHQVRYQQASFAAAQIKYRYGRTTTFELNQIQNQLLAQQTALVANRVTLANQTTALNQELGQTLKEWGIKLRY